MTPEILEYFEGLPTGTPLVAFVGDISRTWFVDLDLLHAVMEILRETRIYRPVRGGDKGFDAWVGKISKALGLVEVYAPPRLIEDAREVRLASLLDGVALLVAFPAERAPRMVDGKLVYPAYKMDPYSADSEIVELAEALGIPVLIVQRTEQVQLLGDLR